MRFTITPLGSAGGRSVGQVVDDIVRYLDGPRPPSATPAGRPAPGETGTSRYYADGSAEPGRWLGNGAAEMSLNGQVDSRDFARVLAGRDPHTGLRLITAQGSAGRRPTLARGTQTRWDAAGEPLYDTRDAAAALKLAASEVEPLLAAGERLRSATSLPCLAPGLSRPSSTVRTSSRSSTETGTGGSPSASYNAAKPAGPPAPIPGRSRPRDLPWTSSPSRKRPGSPE